MRVLRAPSEISSVGRAEEKDRVLWEVRREGGRRQVAVRVAFSIYCHVLTHYCTVVLLYCLTRLTGEEIISHQHAQKYKVVHDTFDVDFKVAANDGPEL